MVALITMITSINRDNNKLRTFENRQQLAYQIFRSGSDFLISSILSTLNEGYLIAIRY